MASKTELVHTFFIAMRRGLVCLGRGEIAKAFKRFNRGFDLIEQILGQQPLLFLPYLYNVMKMGCHYQKNEVLLKLLEQISKIIRKCYPRLRLIEDSMVILSQMSDRERAESSRHVLRSILDCLKGMGLSQTLHLACLPSPMTPRFPFLLIYS